MGKFEKTIYIFWAIALPGLAIYKFINSDSNDKMTIISGILAIVSIIVVALLKTRLTNIEKRKYFKNEEKFTVLVFSIIRDISLICLIAFLSLIIIKITDRQTLENLTKLDIFGSSIYTRFLTFIKQYIMGASVLDFHRTITWLIGLLPENGIFFYILIVVSFLLALFGFAMTTGNITKGSKAVITYYFGFGAIGLLIDHILAFVVLLSFGYAVVLFFIFAFIFGNMGSKEPTPTIESFIGDDEDDYPSFPSLLNSDSDNTKTIHLVSSSNSKYCDSHATYQDEQGNYIDIIIDNGHYHDSSTWERYY